MSVSWGDKLRFETAVLVVQRSTSRTEEWESSHALTLGEFLELFEFTRIKYLCFLLDLVVLYEPLFELRPRR